MRLATLLVTCALFAIFSTNASAQLLEKAIKKVGKKVEKETEKRTDKRINKGIDKAFDKTEEGIDSTVKGDGNVNNKQAAPQGKSTQRANTAGGQAKAVLTWAKYDFVPGAEIIFEDNLQGEQNGEFPSKWDLVQGIVENANLNGENVIMFRKCNTNAYDGIVPLLKNSKEDYLPEAFTIEFDAYYDKYNNAYRIFLLDAKNQKNLDKSNNINGREYLRFYQNAADGKNITKGFYPGFSNADTKSIPSWRHIAISFNKRALKAYIDDARVINIPNIEFNPVGFTIGFHNPSGDMNGYIKNIRIAKGAVPLYDKILTDGKFVTTGIKFDVNQATIKPESMGTISYVVKLMNDHPELKFCVEGHTDSDGADVANKTLSEKRAAAVRNELVSQGISANRLTSKGWGESKPITDNDTPEGKAQNRRVEFVKVN
ncbi:OmpA family protein [uncultured Acetobacteroides sp.]|uniref:OmpA family protein n=1 Tax=uncultured Acetobacteroides sp. TaxID=1760811 RepID=UPI0029F53BAD|nr:OmpA family protein [uncultured Acetobacteroides sp.]